MQRFGGEAAAVAAGGPAGFAAAGATAQHRRRRPGTALSLSLRAKNVTYPASDTAAGGASISDTMASEKTAD